MFGCVMQVGIEVSFFKYFFVTCKLKYKSRFAYPINSGIYMDRTFKSKIGWWYHMIIWIMGICTVLSFVQGQSPGRMITLLLVTLFLIHLMLTTWYKITADGELIVHCSFFPEKKLKVEEIAAVEPTALPVSSYALSLDRLIIYKGEQQWLLISPVNKKEFLKCLRKYNPDIQVKEPSIM